MTHYTAKQVAVVTSATIKNWVRSHNLPHTRTPGEYYKFSNEDIQAIAEYVKHRWGVHSDVY